MQTPPPSLPIYRDLSVTEVEGTEILGEGEESAISDAEQYTFRITQSVLIGGQYIVSFYQNT